MRPHPTCPGWPFVLALVMLAAATWVAGAGEPYTLLVGVANDDEKEPDRVITNTIGMKLVLIPAGEFLMGSHESPEELVNAFPGSKREYFVTEHPQHRVRITKPFYLGAHEVTVGQFRTFVQATRYQTECERDRKGGWGFDPDGGEFRQEPEYTWRDPGFTQSEAHPVVDVSWNDAVAFCRWLSGQEGEVYRLPTEAEWEYACRAGTKTRYHSGEDPESLVAVGNVADAAVKRRFSGYTTIRGDDGYVFTAPVGRFQANAFGLYDMHGNVREWCSDWYGGDYYRSSPAADPKGPSSGKYRVLRGGAFLGRSRNVRSAARRRFGTTNRYINLGFRVVRTSDN